MIHLRYFVAVTILLISTYVIFIALTKSLILTGALPSGIEIADIGKVLGVTNSFVFYLVWNKFVIHKNTNLLYIQGNKICNFLLDPNSLLIHFGFWILQKKQENLFLLYTVFLDHTFPVSCNQV